MSVMNGHREAVGSARAMAGDYANAGDLLFGMVDADPRVGEALLLLEEGGQECIDLVLTAPDRPEEWLPALFLGGLKLHTQVAPLLTELQRGGGLTANQQSQLAMARMWLDLAKVGVEGYLDGGEWE